MDIINQPISDNVGSYIINGLNENYSSFYFMVAYAKLSGVKHLIPHIISFKNNGGKVVGVVGIDQNNTSHQAVQVLYGLCDELFIYHIENNSCTFHPKLYYFNSFDKISFTCGSSNLTEGGLFTNFEINTFNEYTSSDLNFHSIKHKLEETFSYFTTNGYDLNSKKANIGIIQRLIDERYILDEIQMRNYNHSSSTSNNRSSDPLFTSAKYKAPIASVSTDTIDSFIFYKPQNTSDTHINDIEYDDSPDIDEFSDSSINRESTKENDYITTESIPSKLILNESQNYTIDTHASLFGSYDNFLKSFMNPDTNYYYIPQGVHIGHIFYIVKALAEGSNDYRINLFFHSTSGSNGTTVRQTKYKIAACMELLLLSDVRQSSGTSFCLQLINNGRIMYDILNRNVTDPTFYDFTDPKSWRMVHNNTQYYVAFIKSLNTDDKNVLFNIFSNLSIFHLLVEYIRVNSNVTIQNIYSDFWRSPETLAYLNNIGYSAPYGTSLEHRIPFLISLLNSFSLM